MSSDSLSDGTSHPVQPQFAVPAGNPTENEIGTDRFVPRQPKSLENTHLDESVTGALVLKFLFFRGSHTGHEITHQIKLPYHIVERVLFSLRNQLLIGYRGASVGGDYQYELTPKGVEQARHHASLCTYYGAAPVSIEEYHESVKRQSIRNLSPNYAQISQALEDLVVGKATVSQVGQAIRAGKALFLHGAPGNGKTSIAKRIIRAINEPVWIPRTVSVGGEIIRLFDPALHEPAPLPEDGSWLKSEVDDRWIRIQRPLILVGGEFNLNHLEATLNPVTGIIEAPLHMKSNCGCITIDDFGRQKVSPAELLNRWIVPLESRYDYINLPSGRQLKLTFDQLVIFSTNLRPASLCDEAFLRRIPYKVQLFDPTEAQFREIWSRKVYEYELESDPQWIDYLIENHYRKADRAMRFCHADDLVSQIREFCDFHSLPRCVTRENIEVAVNNYFSTF